MIDQEVVGRARNIILNLVCCLVIRYMYELGISSARDIEMFWSVEYDNKASQITELTVFLNAIHVITVCVICVLGT